MTLQTTVEVGQPLRELSVIIRVADGERAEGKFIFGRGQNDERKLAVVFDDSASFHRDLALRYKLRPLGGGWCVLDTRRRLLQLSGRSSQYGRELERDLVVAAFEQALDNYRCERLD